MVEFGVVPFFVRDDATDDVQNVTMEKATIHLVWVGGRGSMEREIGKINFFLHYCYNVIAFINPFK